MNTGQSIIVSSLFLCWAVLLASRTVAAAIYANAPAGSYQMGLVDIGWVIPAAAWVCFVGGLIMLLRSLTAKERLANAP